MLTCADTLIAIVRVFGRNCSLVFEDWRHISWKFLVSRCVAASEHIRDNYRTCCWNAKSHRQAEGIRIRKISILWQKHQCQTTDDLLLQGPSNCASRNRGRVDSVPSKELVVHYFAHQAETWSSCWRTNTRSLVALGISSIRCALYWKSWASWRAKQSSNSQRMLSKV